LSAIEDAAAGGTTEPPELRAAIEEAVAAPEAEAVSGPLESAALTVAPGAGGSLYSAGFVALLAVTLLGFSMNMVLQPVLPVLVLARGGDATLVGLIVAAFSFPSVLLRPVFGRLVDEWNHRRVYLLGALGLAVCSIAYLIPSLAMVFAIRLVHGTAWGAFNTGGHAALARLAPPARRGEASGVFNLMPGLAQFFGPSLGLALVALSGFDAAFLAAAGLALLATLVMVFGPLRLPAAPTHPPRPSVEGGRRLDRFFEPGAVLPMAIEFLFTTSSTLFLVYPPVFAVRSGIPLSDLAFYYPIYGGVLVVSRFLLRRTMDRLARPTIIMGGALVAIVALAVAAAVPTLTGLTIAGALYGFAAAFTSPTIMALAIDRSDPKRVGSAMATYSLGFQMALGVGAAIWGVTIDALGYPAPYLFAAISQVVVIGLIVRGLGRPRLVAGSRP
jgi:predicted MFS family arabinose efflux permease